MATGIGESVLGLAVFGFPVAHSQSPRIHRLFATQAGLNIDYQAIEAQPAEFKSALQAFVDRGGRGCNITVPLKSLAFELADEASPLARGAMAANTLIIPQKDWWVAANTDGPGLLTDLQKNLGFKVENSRICLLGAGGAAAGVAASLMAARPAELVIVNRTRSKAVDLAQRVGGNAIGLDPGELPAAGAFDLVINATSVGHAGKSPELDARLFTPDSLCYDLNYGSAAIPLQRCCQSLGVRVQDGLGMLVEQAAASFTLWTGFVPGTAEVLARVRSSR